MIFIFKLKKKPKFNMIIEWVLKNGPCKITIEE